MGTILYSTVKKGLLNEVTFEQRTAKRSEPRDIEGKSISAQETAAVATLINRVWSSQEAFTAEEG